MKKNTVLLRKKRNVKERKGTVRHKGSGERKKLRRDIARNINEKRRWPIEPNRSEKEESVK
jgi:hypothetical protein